MRPETISPALHEVMAVRSWHVERHDHGIAVDTGITVGICPLAVTGNRDSRAMESRGLVAGSDDDRLDAWDVFDDEQSAVHCWSGAWKFPDDACILGPGLRGQRVIVMLPSARTHRRPYCGPPQAPSLATYRIASSPTIHWLARSNTRACRLRSGCAAAPSCLQSTSDGPESTRCDLPSGPTADTYRAPRSGGMARRRRIPSDRQTPDRRNVHGVRTVGMNGEFSSVRAPRRPVRGVKRGEPRGCSRRDFHAPQPRLRARTPASGRQN